MKTVNKTYRFRLKLGKEQETLLSEHFGCTRFVLNYFLNERKGQYQEIKRTDAYGAQASTLTKLKKQEDTIWLREVNSQTLQFYRNSSKTINIKS